MNAFAPKRPLQIRKYSNRRLYDATNSRHVTADELYRLVRDGHDVVVTDSATGADITHQVLMQMIFEREFPKLEVFPTTLLHEIIRANQQMWKKLAEQWLAGLAAAIAQQADAYARRVADFGWRPLDISMLGKMLSGTLETKPSDAPPTHDRGAAPQSEEDLRSAVRELQEEVRRLSGALAAQPTRVRRKRR
ncbi:MAG TPA: polyhydroxyalkanoate synthesis regulator DNA-binding domain-containing protein [Candidatus Binatia bacterium]|nr:polyhydroxyalkanoate synthesis regulator DNA-binding domain-containing protein [Candidatus Binatia bacterium]